MIQLTAGQIWGLILFLAGTLILSVCTRWESEIRAKLKDPRTHYDKGKDKIEAKKSRGGYVMMIVGTVFALVGYFLVFRDVFNLEP